MKVLIAAGGTGGHIYPGIAVANELMKRHPGSEVLFVGTARGLEKRIVPDNGYQLALINSAGLKNVGFVGKLKGMAVLPRSFFEARKIVRDFRPDVVLGAGGYVSGPVVLTAHFMRCPTMIMDSNALPGFTNRRLARFIDKAALAFDAAKPFFGNKAVVTGNPVRDEFFSIVPRENGTTLNILIFGGSQGARAINEAMLAALPLLDDIKDRLSIIHQSGETNYEAVRTGYEAAGWGHVDVRPYIKDIAESFAFADLIICRSGATTCAEIAAAGRAALMVPFPGAADDHQRKNAEAMAERGACLMLLQSELTGERLANVLNGLINDTKQLDEMGKAARAMATPNAAALTVNIIEELAAGR
jgi:UDP-N-acetylglucosamine--N-acetylmuramyl-(pentapeptide) pyrophosphoryl-undecaprenol N-acetylglucosamine transferase